MLPDHLQDVADMTRQTGAILARPRPEQGLDRANNGLDDHIQGVEVPKHKPSGTRGNLDRARPTRWSSPSSPTPPTSAWCREASADRRLGSLTSARFRAALCKDTSCLTATRARF